MAIHECTGVMFQWCYVTHGGQKTVISSLHYQGKLPVATSYALICCLHTKLTVIRLLQFSHHLPTCDNSWYLADCPKLHNYSQPVWNVLVMDLSCITTLFTVSPISITEPSIQHCGQSQNTDLLQAQFFSSSQFLQFYIMNNLDNYTQYVVTLLHVFIVLMFSLSCV